MGRALLIVESPAKARSMSKYLGKEFKALASYGHVRDLLPKTGAVDPDNNFDMRYEIVERNQKHVDLIIKEMKKSDALYLATDPDREGEAISWHLYELLKEQGVIGDKPVYRVEFHEITRAAIQKAVENPRELSINLIEAQQARRALDYLVGFNLSPLLWRKIRQGPKTVWTYACWEAGPSRRNRLMNRRLLEKKKRPSYGAMSWTVSLRLEPFFRRQYHGTSTKTLKRRRKSRLTRRRPSGCARRVKSRTRNTPSSTSMSRTT